MVLQLQGFKTHTFTILDKSENDFTTQMETRGIAINPKDRIYRSIVQAQVVDRQNDIIDHTAFVKALGDWQVTKPVIRYEHNKSIVIGEGLMHKIIDVRDETSGNTIPAVEIIGRIYDNRDFIKSQEQESLDMADMVWEGIKNKSYRGSSFGGQPIDGHYVSNSQNGITAYWDNMTVNEISICKEPVNQLSLIMDWNEMAKSYTSEEYREKQIDQIVGKDGLTKACIKCKNNICMVKSISNDLDQNKTMVKSNNSSSNDSMENDKTKKEEEKKTEGNEHIEKAVTSIASTMEKFMEKSIENGKEITDNFSSINKSIESLNERLETFEKSNSDGDAADADGKKKDEKDEMNKSENGDGKKEDENKGGEKKDENDEMKKSQDKLGAGDSASHKQDAGKLSTDGSADAEKVQHAKDPSKAGEADGKTESGFKKSLRETPTYGQFNKSMGTNETKFDGMNLVEKSLHGAATEEERSNLVKAITTGAIFPTVTESEMVDVGVNGWREYQ